MQLVALLLVLSGLVSTLHCHADATELTVTFFDIGQGDSTLIVSPTGKRVLIDGGPPEAGERLVAYLAARHIDSIDLVVLSHPHADHLGGLKRVIGAVPIKMFIDAAYPSNSPGYVGLMNALSARGVAVKQATAGRQIDLGGGAMLKLLGPPTPWLAHTRSDINANSVVARLTWQSRTALFTGDSEPETERWLLEPKNNGGDTIQLRAELLKVAHHGGKYSSTAAFLQAVAPRIAVISVGTGNDYGHPTPEALARLAQVGARVLRTDLSGEVTVRSRNGQPWAVQTSRSGAPVAQESGGRTAPNTPVGPSVPDVPVATPSPVGAAVGSVSYVASSRSQVFHRSDCGGGLRIAPANLLRFATREAALASGRRPAEDCDP